MKQKNKKNQIKFTYEHSPEKDKFIDGLLEQSQCGEISLERALATLDNIAAKHPFYPSVFFAMGVIYKLDDDIEQAYACFEKASDLNPLFLEALHNQAMCCQEMADLGGAVLSLRAIVERGDSEDELVLMAKETLKVFAALIQEHYQLDLETYVKDTQKFKFAQRKMQEKKWDLALPVLHRLLKKTPMIPSIWNNISLCYAHQGKKQLALEYAHGALNQDKDYAPALHNLDLLETMKEGEILQVPSIWTQGSQL